MWCSRRIGLVDQSGGEQRVEWESARRTVAPHLDRIAGTDVKKLRIADGLNSRSAAIAGEESKRSGVRSGCVTSSEIVARSPNLNCGGSRHEIHSSFGDRRSLEYEGPRNAAQRGGTGGDICATAGGRIADRQSRGPLRSSGSARSSRPGQSLGSGGSDRPARPDLVPLDFMGAGRTGGG